LKGEADFFICPTRAIKWDICAGHAILLSLGGEATDLVGNQIDYSINDIYVPDGLIASLNAENHLKIIELLK